MNEKLSERIARFSRIDIYPVISSEFCAGRTPLEVLRGIGAGGARVVQLREKNMPRMELAKLALEFRKVTDGFGMSLIINDHVDIAVECDADGVHLGQDDMPLDKAREFAPELVIGVSTHSEFEAFEAQEAGASYINIGPIYHTGTKSLPMEPLGLDVLRNLAPKIKIPFTVMGGIKARHIPELVALGAARIAMVTEITQAEDVSSKVRELRNLFDTNN